MEVTTLNLRAKDLDLLKRMLREVLPGKRVWAFGSRTHDTSSEKSDLDLVTFQTSESDLHDAQSAISASDIAPRIDLHRWEDLPTEYQRNITDHYFPIQ